MAIGVSRFMLPEEFFDLTSAQLLIQPEPQYLHARLCMAACGIELAAPEMLGMAGRGVGGNGDYVSPEVGRLLLSDRMIPEALFAVKADFKGAPGHTIRFNRPRYIDSTYTEASRELKTGTSISTTPIAVGASQVPLTLKRYGGPYSSAVQPYAIEAFDAQMGVHNLAKVVGSHLRRDFHKTLDSFLVALIDAAAAAGSNTVYPLGITADNDMTSKDYPLTYEQITRTAQTMNDDSLPVFPDGKRLMICTSHSKKQLQDDPQFMRYSEFHKEVNPLFAGYFRSTPDFHLLESRTITRTANTSSVDVHKCQAIAPGALGCGVGRPPRVASSSSDNYGETALVIWLADLALGTLDNSFVYSVRHSASAV